MNKEQAKRLLEEDLNFMQSLSVQEYTLYRNWSHMNTDEMKKWFYDNAKTIREVKRNI